MKYFKHLAYVLLLLGGINWGIYGLFGFDIVDVLLGFEPLFARIVYDVIGLSALFIIITHFSSRNCCSYCDKKNCNENSLNNYEAISKIKNKDLEQETKIYEIKTGEEINFKIN